MGRARGPRLPGAWETEAAGSVSGGGKGFNRYDKEKRDKNGAGG